MSAKNSENTYEEVGKQRLEENKKNNKKSSIPYFNGGCERKENILKL